MMSPELEMEGWVIWMEESVSTIVASPKRAIWESKLGVLWKLGKEKEEVGFGERVRRERTRKDTEKIAIVAGAIRNGKR